MPSLMVRVPWIAKTDEDLQDWIGSNIFNVILQEAAVPPGKRKRKTVETLKEALEK